MSYNPYPMGVGSQAGMGFMPQMQTNVPSPMSGAWQQPAPGQQLIRVTGIEGAKAYQMGPNSVVPLFDADNDVMYVKSTDGAGFPTIRTFSFTPVEQAPSPDGKYVTHDELNSVLADIREMIANAQQPVSAAEPATAKPAARSRKSASGD